MIIKLFTSNHFKVSPRLSCTELEWSWHRIRPAMCQRSSATCVQSETVLSDNTSGKCFQHDSLPFSVFFSCSQTWACTDIGLSHELPSSGSIRPPFEVCTYWWLRYGRITAPIPSTCLQCWPRVLQILSGDGYRGSQWARTYTHTHTYSCDSQRYLCYLKTEIHLTCFPSSCLLRVHV